MSELTYTRCGDYYIPDLKLSEQPEAPIGKYGRMRQRYLKEHRPGLYSSLILSEKLYPHLLEIDRAAQERLDTMLPRMMEAAGVTEELKARDPMRWVGADEYIESADRRNNFCRTNLDIEENGHISIFLAHHSKDYRLIQMLDSRLECTFSTF